MVGYSELLEALIQHLEDLRRQGRQTVAVTPCILAALRHSGSWEANAPQTCPIEENQPAEEQSEPAPPPALPLAEAAPAIIPPPSLPPSTSTMESLKATVLTCQKCPHLVRSRRNVVFGVGDIHSPLMFVGEAPGMEEDLQGEPFVGKAGQLLTRIIQAMGFTRDTVYIANILKCRPDTPGQSYGNRKPEPAEIANCISYLDEQIRMVRPQVLVGLGATALQGLLQETTPITRLRGHFREYQGIPLMPTYHPSYLLRNTSLKTKREVWEDMLQVLEKLGRPISEKQRNYFLKAASEG